MTKTLSFSLGNAKLSKDTAIFSLPAGHTCKFAELCRSNANRQTGKITDGPHTQFRCYATAPEALFPNIRKSRWNNFELLKEAKTTIGMASLIGSALMAKRSTIKLVRFHASGDFFSQEYFDAWLLVAKNHPEWLFYGYSKALPYWVNRLGSIPNNFKIVASRGGTHDALIEQHGLRSVKVVYTEKEAKKLKLELDHDDTLVWKGTKSFAILLHGSQPAGSEAGKAWQLLKTKGRGGYKSDYFAHYAKNKPKGKIMAGIPIINGVPRHPKTLKKLPFMPRWAVA